MESDAQEILVHDEEQGNASGLPAKNQLEDADSSGTDSRDQLPVEIGQPEESPDGHVPVLESYTKDEKDDHKTYTPEERLTFLRALEMVYKAGPEHLGEHMPAVLELLEPLGNLNGPMSIKALEDVKGEQALHHLWAINLLGMEMSPGLVLSPLGTAVLLAFFSYHTGQNEMRQGIALTYALFSDEGRIKALLSRLLKCNTDRIDFGVEELIQSGVNLAPVIPNAPGAGRPTVDDSLYEHIMPYIMAALNLSEEEARAKIQAMTETAAGGEEGAMHEESHTGKEEKVTAASDDASTNTEESSEESSDAEESPEESSNTEESPEESSDTEESPEESPSTEVSPEESSDTKESPETPVDSLVEKTDSSAKVPETYQDICQAFQELTSISDETLATIRELLTRGKKGDMGYLYSFRSFITSMMEDIKKALENSPFSEDDQKAVFPSEDGDASVCPPDEGIAGLPDDRDSLRKHLYKKLALSQLAKTVISLQVVCKEINKAISSVDAVDDPYTYGYRQIKACSKAVPFKSRSRLISQHWWGYHLALDTAQEMADAILANRDIIEAADRRKALRLDLAGLYDKAWNSLTALIKRFEEGCPDGKGNSRLKKALAFLRDKEHLLETEVKPQLESEDVDIRYSISILLLHFSPNFERWLACLKEEGTCHADVLQIADKVCYKYFQEACSFFYKDFTQAVKASLDHQTEGDDEGISTESSTNVEDPDASRPMDRPDEDEAKEVEATVTELLEAFEALLENLLKGKDARRNRSNNKEDKINTIKEAATFLDEEYSRFKKLAEKKDYLEDAVLCHAMGFLASALLTFIQGKLQRWEKEGDGYAVSYPVAASVSGSMTGKRFMGKFTMAWNHYESEVKDGITQDTLIGGDMPSEPRLAYRTSGCLSPRERCRLVRSFLDAGRNPLDIAVWIDYIIETEGLYYGDPGSALKCCPITQKELQRAFYHLTGVLASENTLWNVFRKRLGYTRRACVKLDQVGNPHPMGDQQMEYIRKILSEADLKRTLILSADTKAFVVLGRLKHDNGVLMCSPDGSVYRVYDHDYPFKLYEIYKNRTTNLVSPERMKEDAILRPVGVYCINDKSGYVSLVIGKDTAESMHSLLYKVIMKKKEEMPELENVMILTDGGGANMAGGVQWMNELEKLSREVHLNLDIHHYPPGKSRHNEIEHRLWGPISTHWKGKPFLTIEHVKCYIEETAAFTENLTITCYVDKRKYETLIEKKAANKDVMTRSKLQENLKGRLIYQFEEGSHMNKWNYCILHKAQKASA